MVNTVVATVAVGNTPEAAAYDSQDGDIYVANAVSNSVTVISDASNTAITSISVGSSPVAIAYDSANGQVYVTNYGSNTVSVISGVFNTVISTLSVGVSPEGVACDAANGDIYVADGNSNNVTVISGAGAIIASLPVGNTPLGVAYDSTNGDVYVANEGSGNVSVISGATNRLSGTIPVGTGPYAVAFDSGDGNLYVANYYSSNVTVISGISNRPMASITVGDYPDGIGYDSGNAAIYVADTYSGNVTVIADATDAVVGYVAVGKFPGRQLAYDPANGDVYVPDAGSVAVSVIAGGFTVEFDETGLVPGTGWSVVFAGTLGASTASVLEFIALPASYSFQVPPLAGYTVSPSGGSATIGGTYLVAVNFSAVTYPVTLSESGLVPGTIWSATIDGQPRSSTGSSIVIDLMNGTYSYTVSTVSNYTLTGGAGTVDVAGAQASIGATFTPLTVTYPVTVNETGLAAGTTWSAIVAGVEKTTTGSSLTYSLPAGTYSYQVLPAAGYSASALGGTASVSGAYLIVVAFTAVTTETTPATQVSVGGYSTSLDVAIGVAALALGVGLAALWMSRRPPAPSAGSPSGVAARSSGPPPPP
ncbi:MAG: hypothetical protein ACREDK_09035 [Thermoplasmata archaeon]